MSHQPPVDLPTPEEAARASLAEGAKDMAQSALMRQVRRFARDKLPRPVYRLIFSGKSAGEVAKEEGKRRLRSLIWGCAFTLVFAGVVGVVLLGVIGVVLWAVLFA